MKTPWRVLYELSDKTEEAVAPGAVGEVSGGCAMMGIMAALATCYYLLKTVAPASQTVAWVDGHLVGILLAAVGAYAVYGIVLGFWLGIKGDRSSSQDDEA